MNNYAIDKKLLKQLALIRHEKKPSEEILNSLYAQAILEYAIYAFEKNDIWQKIDQALLEKDEQKFYKLSTQYNELLDRYRDGKTLNEKGYDWHIQFTE